MRINAQFLARKDTESSVESDFPLSSDVFCGANTLLFETVSRNATRPPATARRLRARGRASARGGLRRSATRSASRPARRRSPAARTARSRASSSNERYDGIDVITTGIPDAIASAAGKPKPSSRWFGAMSTSHECIEPRHLARVQRDVKLLDGIQRLLARRRPRRDADQIELLMEPARMRRRAVAFGDAFEIDLRLAAEQHAQRLVFGRRARAEELVVDDLADVRDVVRELLADRRSATASRPASGSAAGTPPRSRARIGWYAVNAPS